jgi:hypothetical protein
MCHNTSWSCKRTCSTTSNTDIHHIVHAKTTKCITYITLFMLQSSKSIQLKSFGWGSFQWAALTARVPSTEGINSCLDSFQWRTWRGGLAGGGLRGGATTTGARAAACGRPAAGGVLARTGRGVAKGSDNRCGRGGRTTTGRQWRPGPGAREPRVGKTCLGRVWCPLA